MSVLNIEENLLVGKETFAVAAAAIPHHRPTNIFLDANLVAEDAGNNEGIGWFTAEDQDDDGEIFTFSLIDDAGGLFSIDEYGQLLVANASLLDYETVQSHTITVRVTDRTGLTFDKSFVISVTDSGFDGKATGPLLFGSDGADTLLGTAGDDTISGAFGNDILQGFAGKDWLRGNGGNDTLKGGDGDDWLAGHEGNDVL